MPGRHLAPGGQGIKRVAVDDANARLTVLFRAPITAQQRLYLFKPQSYSLTGGQRRFPRILKAEPSRTAAPLIRTIKASFSRSTSRRFLYLHPYGQRSRYRSIPELCETAIPISLR